MEATRKPRSALGPLLFVTWLVSIASMITGAEVRLATLVALVLTLLFCNLSYVPNQRGWSRWNPSASAKAPWSRIGPALVRIREIRRRTRPEYPVRFVNKPARRAAPTGKLAPLSLEEEQVQPALPREDRWSGLLTLLALAALILMFTAMLVEASDFLVKSDDLYLFMIIDLFGIALLPLLIGIFCRCEIHSILTMIALSTASQAIIFRLTGSVPDWRFSGMAIALIGIPLGLGLLFGRIDRRSEAGCLETTQGKLLRGKRLRREWRMRPGQDVKTPDILK
jgi:hypothetical protein